MRRTIAVVAVALTLSGRLPVRAAVTELERQRLVAHLDMTARWLVDEVSGLTSAQIEFRTAPDSWTISEVIEHLVVVAPIYWQDLQAAVNQPPGDPSGWMTDADVLWYGIDRTRREQAIPTERPTGQLHDLRAGLDTLRAHHDRLRDYAATTPVDLRAHRVQRQRCDAYQWALMISAHEQRHVLQIREIKADPKFPKV